MSERSNSSDDDIRRVTVGEPTLHDGPILIADPDPSWPGAFVGQSDRIRSALGNRVLLREHVGSTSVPGLPAKPIIDIVLALEELGRRGGVRAAPRASRLRTADP